MTGAKVPTESIQTITLRADQMLLIKLPEGARVEEIQAFGQYVRRTLPKELVNRVLIVTNDVEMTVVDSHRHPIAEL